MIYMVNPSEPPKRKRKSKKRSRKSRMRRNPELLIVNPYSLDEEGEGKETNMAKRKSRKRKKGRRMARRRRNPDIKATVNQILGTDAATGALDYHKVKQAVMAAAGGGLALCVATAALGKHVEVGTNMGKALVSLAAGVGGGVVLHAIAEAVGQPMLQDLAVHGAFGAMVLGGWQLLQPFVEPACEKINQSLGLSGWLGEDGMSTYTSDIAGWSPYGAHVEETIPGLDGFGISSLTESDVDALIAEKSGLGSTAYEPLGDIYGGQRLGAFEMESGFGAHVPEQADALLHQQDKDKAAALIAKRKAGGLGGFAGYEFAGEGAAVIASGEGVWGNTVF